ncbi:ABC transporter permease [Amycolatopsis suaedae]|uniref:Transport permease protein n=1 Tax=Amycolatopsis suaedae TaxID=2510978 RepID=A0A4Q7J5V9_9PSEU|nr:ABC transporter permease [Amycolatopsis suaedae]RZQ62507.1 ABC transporter permease [Amycolatopsis suaedae]
MTATLDVAAIRPVSRVQAWGPLMVAEAKLLWRDPGSLITPLGLPLLIMVMNGLRSNTASDQGLAGMRYFDALATPAALAMIVAVTGMINVPSVLAAYRKAGVLRRMSATPVGPGSLLGAQVAVNLVLSVIGIAIALAVAFAGYDLAMPRQLGWALLGLALGACSLYAFGLLIAAIAPSANSAVGLGLVLFFATFAAGGGFLPMDLLPSWLASIGEVLPYGAAVQVMSDAWIGQTPQLIHLAVLGGTTVVFGGLAAKLFRWE